MNSRRIAFGVGLVLLLGLVTLGATAPEYVSEPQLDLAYQGMLEAPPFGRDERGIPLWEYARQGASIVAMPAALGGLAVMVMATVAGLVRCAGLNRLDTLLQIVGEIIGSLPRMVLVLVVALMLGYDKSLYPIALAWAVLAAPAAMDEAAASAGRLGGARFVEALRAHGFSAGRIYLYHVVWMNLRPVLVRQGAEVASQVVFLEIALSYLALAQSQPSFTHQENLYSWATLLYNGYTAFLGQPMYHSLFVGVLLMAGVAAMAHAFRLAARAR